MKKNKNKKKNKNLMRFLASLAVIFMSLSKYVHKRDIMAFLLGALAMIISVRLFCTIECVAEMPNDTTTPVESVEPEEPTYNEEAANIARVLYGVREYQLSEDAKIAIIETIFSRAECTYGEFGDTVNEVCLKPLQWQGFVEDSSYLREDYDLALQYLEGDRTMRITPEGCYWLVVSRDGVTVRTKFEGGNSWTIN